MNGGARQHAKPPEQKAKRKPAAKAGSGAQADKAPSLPLSDAARVFSPGAKYWLTHDPDLANMRPDQLFDEANQIEEWKRRQIASYADTDASRLDRVQQALLARANLFNGAPPDKKRGKKKKAGAPSTPAPGNVPRPRVLDQKMSVAPTHRGDVVRDYNEIATYLRQPDIPAEERRTLQAMLANLYGPMSNELALRSQERENALISEALGWNATGGDADAQRSEIAKRTESIQAVGGDTGMNALRHGRERILLEDYKVESIRNSTMQMFAQQADAIQDETQQLQNDWHEFVDRTYDEHPYVGFTTMLVAEDNPLNWGDVFMPDVQDSNIAITRMRQLQAQAKDPWNSGQVSLTAMADELSVANKRAGAALDYYNRHYDNMMGSAASIVKNLQRAKSAGQIAASIAFSPAGAAFYSAGESLLVQNREIHYGQRDSYDVRSVVIEGVSTYAGAKVTNGLMGFAKPGAGVFTRVGVSVVADRAGSATGVATNMVLQNRFNGGKFSATDILKAAGNEATDAKGALLSLGIGKLTHYAHSPSRGAKGKTGELEATGAEEPTKKKEQASLTAIAQRPQEQPASRDVPPPQREVLPPGQTVKPDVTHTDPGKAKGTLGEVTVPFERYPGSEWNHIGGGSETASSRTNIARRSSYDKALGQEGTAGNDFIVEHKETGMLVVGGENKATKGETFNDATAITTSLQKNIEHSANTLEARANEIRAKSPAEAQQLDQTVKRLRDTHDALKRGAEGDKTARLPDNVVLELTNVLGEGKQLGKQHIDLLAKEYGNNPEFLDHLLDRTQVRDPDLARARRGGAEGEGKRGTATDPDVVRAKDILTPEGQDALARVREGFGTNDAAWKKHKEAQQKQQQKAATDAKKAEQNARKQVEKDARKEARGVGEQAREEALAQLKKDTAQDKKPKAGTKARQKYDAKLANEAKRAGRKAEDKAFDEAMAPHREQDAKAAAEKKAAREAEKVRKQESAKKRAEERKANAAAETARKQALAQSEASVKSVRDMTPEQFSNMPKEQFDSLRRAAASDPVIAREMQKKVDAGARTPDMPAPKQNATPESVPAKAQPTESTTVKTQAPESAPAKTPTESGSTKSPAPEPVKTQTPEKAPSSSRTNEPNQNQNRNPRQQSRMDRAAYAMNQGAAVLRASDAYEDAIDRGEGKLRASASAFTTYMENSNPIVGAVGNLEGKLSQEKKPDGTTQQYYGEDRIDAVLGTVGEAGAAMAYPGAAWDQVVNAGANLISAGDDHLKRKLAPDDPQRQKANLRTVTDVVADVTPSRMVAQTAGAGLRSWYDIGKALGGQTSGVDKFADDALNEKLGTIFVPPAMLADFVGNLGGSDASHALDQTLKKTRNTKLAKIGNASGDALYDFGQSESAKKGEQGMATQGLSMMTGMASDMIRGDSLERAMEKAADAGKGSLADKVGSKLGDTAFETVQAAQEAHERLSNWWKKL